MGVGDVAGDLTLCCVTIIRKVGKFVRSHAAAVVAHKAWAIPSQSPKQRAHMFYDQDKAEVGRLLGLDIVDWSMLLVAIGLTALIVVLA